MHPRPLISKITHILLIQSLPEDPFVFLNWIMTCRTALTEFAHLLANKEIIPLLTPTELNNLRNLTRALFKTRPIVDRPPHLIFDEIKTFKQALKEKDAAKRTMDLVNCVHETRKDIPVFEKIILPVKPSSIRNLFAGTAACLTQPRPKADMLKATIDNPQFNANFKGKRQAFIRYFKLPFNNQLEAVKHIFKIPVIGFIPEKLTDYDSPSACFEYQLKVGRYYIDGNIIPYGAAGVLRASLSSSLAPSIQRSTTLLITTDYVREYFIEHENYWPHYASQIILPQNEFTSNLPSLIQKNSQANMVVLIDERWLKTKVEELVKKIAKPPTVMVMQYFSRPDNVDVQEPLEYAIFTTVRNADSTFHAGYFSASRFTEHYLKYKMSINSWHPPAFLSSALSCAHESDKHCDKALSKFKNEEMCVTQFFRNLTQDPSLHSLTLSGGSTYVIQSLANESEKNVLVSTLPTYNGLLHFKQKQLCITLTNKENFKLTPQRLELFLHESAHLLKDAVIDFLLCNPGNPIGVYYSKIELQNLELILKNFGKPYRFILDMAHYDIAVSQQPLPQGVITGENVLLIYSLSKTYGLPGLRVGFMAGTYTALKKVAHLYQSQQAIDCSHLAAHSIFNFDNDIARKQFLAENNHQYQKSLNLLKLLMYGMHKSALPHEQLNQTIEYFHQLMKDHKHEMPTDKLLQGLPGADALIPTAGYVVVLRFPGWVNKHFKMITPYALLSNKLKIEIKDGGDIGTILRIYRKKVLPIEVCGINYEIPAIRITLTSKTEGTEHPDKLLLHTFINLHEIARNIKVSHSTMLSAKIESHRL